MTKNPICEPISPISAYLRDYKGWVPDRFMRKRRDNRKRNKPLRVKPSHKEFH